jgi:hypothetical protein
MKTSGLTHYFLGTAIALVGLGIAADQTLAQSPCNPQASDRQCGVTYYNTQPVGLSPGGYVTTSTGIGLNVREGPGLAYPVIGGADDGVYIDLAGETRVADGYRWREVTTGGWVATEYIAGASNAGLDTNCYYGNVSYYNNPCGQGGDTQTVRPVSQSNTRPNSQTNNNRPVVRGPGPYVVAIPGGSPALLSQVRGIIRGARLDSAPQGAFVNAGGFRDYEGAKSLSYLLRSRGLDARVIYR